jgi:hypothetical protein
MKLTTFERLDEDSLIVTDAKIGNHKLFLAVDTGASHTTVDLNALLIAGYRISDAIRDVEIETANGIVKGYVFKVKKIYALGITIENVEICAYDFFSSHVLTDFDGVLGLDFFKGTKFCIDMVNNQISVHIL